MSEFDEYIVHGEQGQREKADVWQTAIGLQDVDKLNTFRRFVRRGAWPGI